MINLISKSVHLRLVEERDAEFICHLRTNSELNQFISTSSADIEAQKEWIRNYKVREVASSEYYFIICRNSDELPIGTVRLYDFKENPKSFCWGSWILNENKTNSSALESSLLVYEFGFQQLGFEQSHYDVMKGNDKVHSFHTKMGAKKIAEDSVNIYYHFLSEQHVLNKLRFQKYL